LDKSKEDKSIDDKNKGNKGGSKMSRFEKKGTQPLLSHITEKILLV